MMTRQFFACAAAACVFSAGLAAQAPTPQKRSGEANRVTVSGCVERADQMLSASATTTVDSLSFVLIKPVAEKPTGTSGVAGAPKDSGNIADRMYRLDAAVEDLNSHVGQKVEISGTLADMPTEPAGTGASTNVPRLRVDSVKVLNATCPR
jgi:hypothetical protein